MAIVSCVVGDELCEDVGAAWVCPKQIDVEGRRAGSDLASLIICTIVLRASGMYDSYSRCVTVFPANPRVSQQRTEGGQDWRGSRWI